MKVLHISTYDIGGAAKAGVRLHQGLLKNKVDSSFMSLFSSGVSIEKSNQHQYTVKEKVLENLRIRLGFEKSGSKLIYERMSLGLLEFASLISSNFNVLNQNLYKEADIINLHWINGYLDFSSFFKNNKKPIVWTLHDMNPFSGIYHYKEDEKRNLQQLKKLDYEFRKIKSKGYLKANIHLISPSQWIYNASKDSELLGQFPNYHIPNGLDEEVFRDYSQVKSRDELNLPQGKKILLFVSQHLSNYRKGFDLLQQAISLISSREPLVLAAVGEKNNSKNNNIHYLGIIKDEITMAKAYSAADVFILPSREDNLPNVLLESLCCGTPVISFPVGGMLDVIENGFNGYISENISAESLAAAINKWVRTSESLDSKSIREDAIKKFSIDIQTNSYLRLYKNILNS